MRYATLLTIELTHAFYTHGKSADFRLVPSPECARILAAHKMRWQELFSSWRGLTPLVGEKPIEDESDAPLYPLEAGTQLRFFLQVVDPAVLQFTQFLKDPETGLPKELNMGEAFRGEVFVHYQNLQGALLTASTHYEVQGDAFQVSEPAAEEAFRLKGHPVSGLIRSQIQIEGYSQGYNIARYDASEKKVWVNTLGFAPGQEFRLLYRAVPDWAKQAFGLVDITISEPSDLRKTYQIALSSRRVKWKYYVVANTAVTGIEDKTGDTNELKFNSTAPNPADDPVAKWLRQKLPEAPVLTLFESTTEIPFGESMSKDLRITPLNHTKPLRLPIPSRNQSEIQIITYFPDQ